MILWAGLVLFILDCLGLSVATFLWASSMMERILG